ncbi:HAMP domain-containing protein [Caloramator quimbayensis]|uniref:histidine kinase n=1 Tax=Caloramator quimbayensis TaxID=1147123 RepID=A0A1T4Y7H9_9CLOT|nr:HAMP domain-containing protein [Caloramator quimbayensis]
MVPLEAEAPRGIGNMENKQYRKFKDDIRKTFILYALIPVIIITVSSYLFFLGMWYKTIKNQNNNINFQLSRRIDKILNNYINEAYIISREKLVIDTIMEGSGSSRVYNRFYSFVNSRDVRSSFFIFDKNMNIIAASSRFLPSYAVQNSFYWGIIKRMNENKDYVVLEREIYEENSKKVLTVGKAVIKDGEIIGYITFDLDERDFVRIISENFSIDIVITDKYSNVISSTNSLFINQFGKIDENLKDKKGFVKAKNDSFYVKKSALINNYLYVYTITSIGYVSSVFIFIGIFIVLTFILLIITMLSSAKKIADSKTKSIDKIIEAIENVQNGDLDTKLNIETKDEFEIIAESYNKMLKDLKNLIEVNKEEAKHSVLSEIKQLESQFNPHFLFNTLEMIKYMVKLDVQAADKIIISLSSLLRYSINNNIDKIPLIEDVEYTKNYLTILKYRFDKRFDYAINIEKEAKDCIVPKLIIQPLIENAIEHGFEGRQHLNVDVKAFLEDSNLCIIINDDGAGMDEDKLSNIRQILYSSRNNSSHLGIFNVHRRIQLMYGKKYGVEINSEREKGTTVKIMLPVDGGEEYA